MVILIRGQLIGVLTFLLLIFQISKRPGEYFKARKIFAEQRKSEISAREKCENVKENHGLIIRHEFEQVTEKKQLMNTLRRDVSAGLQAAGSELQARRER
jgi:hypothetical protein